MASENDASMGHIVVEGTVRGVGFNANRLVHIPGFGDFQVDRIEKLSKSRVNKKSEMDIDTEENDVFLPNENRETLEELNPEEIDMEGEEWDDEDEFGVRMEESITLKTEKMVDILVDPSYQGVLRNIKVDGC